MPSNVGTTLANTANTTYVLAAGSVLDGSAVPITIDASAAVAGRVFSINGVVNGGNTGLFIGTALSPSPSARVTIGLGGLFYSTEIGQAALRLFGDGHEVINNGSIFALGADSIGIFLQGANGAIANLGAIEADTGIEAISDGALISNFGTITGNYGITVSAAAAAGTRIENGGLINAEIMAITGGDGNDTVINSGGINGDVDLGGGDDRFINKGGEMNGTVIGGLGNDVYQFGTRTFDIVEAAAGGTDTVRSAADVDVSGQEIEIIVLTGKRNVDATGSDNANTITGNDGRNELEGEAGNDTLRGGKGNDTLTGGLDADIFVFRLDGSTDTVTDYADETDRIDLSGIDGLKGFKDLRNNYMSQEGVDLHISDGNTTVILLNTLKTDMDAGDFIF
jgi:serralysin